MLERDDFSASRHHALAFWWSMIISENRYSPAELGCSRVLPLSIAQIGNIRFAVVKPEGRLFRDHALAVVEVVIEFPDQGVADPRVGIAADIGAGDPDRVGIVAVSDLG